MTEVKRQELETYKSNMIVVTVKHDYDTFHDDDTDHFHGTPFKVKGRLTKLYCDGIVLTECSNHGYPRQYWHDGINHYESRKDGESYFPFDYSERTHLSYTHIQIISIENEDNA